MNLVDAVAEPESEFNHAAEMDHVDAINQVFAEFEFAYHNQFHKAFATSESLVIAKKYWLSSLEHYSPTQITQAAKRIIGSQDYLPSIATIIRACGEGIDLFGLPAARQAYQEACSASSPKIQYSWSHQAVYLAGKAASWYLLANEAEAKAFPVFQYHYALLCKRVIDGEQLAVDLPTPLPEKIGRKLEKEEIKERIAKLKKELRM
ncbi:MAG: hypothetical protein IIC60_07890 [Proteobacteria bacterium]|nr:hypothetical protein [Pseudomonadota bacterium]